MKKKVIIILLIVVLLILLVPIQFHLKDGGTIEYRALLYKVSKVHSLVLVEDAKIGYNKGIIIEILGLEIYNNVTIEIPSITESQNNKEETDVTDFTSKINININGTNYTATLEDNETSREFVSRLPLEINMNELNGNEKYYNFNESLPSNPSKIGNINNGDLMLYGSDCLVLFYESFNSSYSYTRIGRIDNPSSLKTNLGKGNVKVSFSSR